jgi:hypothetical protein
MSVPRPCRAGRSMTSGSHPRLTRPHAPAWDIHRRRFPALEPTNMARQRTAASASCAGGQAAAANLSAPSASGRGQSLSRGELIVRLADPVEYWAAADLHCMSYGDAADRTSLKALMTRVDRILAMQINDKLAEDGAGR